MPITTFIYKTVAQSAQVDNNFMIIQTQDIKDENLLTNGKGNLIDGSHTLFTTKYNYVPIGTQNSLIVYVDGIRQRKGAGLDYTETGANTFTFIVAPVSGQDVYCDYRQVL